MKQPSVNDALAVLQCALILAEDLAAELSRVDYVMWHDANTRTMNIREAMEFINQHRKKLEHEPRRTNR